LKCVSASSVSETSCGAVLSSRIVSVDVFVDDFAAESVAVAVSVVLVLDWTVGLTLAQQLAIGVALGVLVPLAFFRYARSLWLVMNYLVAMAEQRRER